MRLGWFDFRKFDIAEYEHYEKIENGDLNWVIPGRLLAFSSPYDSGKDDSGVPSPPRRTCSSRPKTTCPSSRSWA
jgi:cell division cycle 14